MSEEKELLNEENLSKVAGGGGPDEYIYRAELLVGVRVKTEPRADAEDVCVAPMYTLVYVLQENCGNNFVYGVFKGEHHREWGYIKEEYLGNRTYKN